MSWRVGSNCTQEGDFEQIQYGFERRLLTANLIDARAQEESGKQLARPEGIEVKK